MKRKYSPASKDWSISSKGLVLFSAITLVCCCQLIFSSDGVSCLFCLPFFLFPHFLPLLSPSPDFSLRRRHSARRDGLASHSGTHLVHGGGKAPLSHFLRFSWKISSRSGLSLRDRDPGGEEMGCCCNRFLHHHFLQLDSFEIVSPHFLTMVVVLLR